MVWMVEALYYLDYILGRIRERYKSKPFTPAQTSYENGFQQGALSERSEVNKLLEYLDSDLKKQLEDFKEQHKLD